MQIIITYMMLVITSNKPAQLQVDADWNPTSHPLLTLIKQSMSTDQEYENFVMI